MRVWIMALLVLIAGCSYNPRHRAVTGGLIGGAGGIAAGAIAGGGTGALIGGPVGAAGGAAVGALTAPTAHQTLSSRGSSSRGSAP